MSTLKGNLVIGQSGGPTAVINASAVGAFTAALAAKDVIENVYAAAHGIVGILNEDFYDIGAEDPKELNYLKNTPSSMIGSCRYKLATLEQDETDYKRILEVFKKYNIRYFLYNGGNDSMDTCNKVSKYFQTVGYDCRVVGIPKTIDNDLCSIDHCPGFPSAAKYIATTIMEVYQDACVYDIPTISVVEIMGRHAGWLTAAASLANFMGSGPDLIYLPETSFSLEKLIKDVKKCYEKNNKVMICISEGVQTEDGKFIPELMGDVAVDSFGHKQLGGAAHLLANYIKKEMNCKVRDLELSLLQRSAAHLASAVDVDEAFRVGEAAVKFAIEGKTDIMVGLERRPGKEYYCDCVPVSLADSANTEKTFPLEWINEAGNQILPAFYDYALPLIQGSANQATEHGLPRFGRLKKVKVKK